MTGNSNQELMSEHFNELGELIEIEFFSDREILN